jgi:hypothetical protein
MTKMTFMIMTVSVCVLNTYILGFRVITNSIYRFFLADPWDFSHNPNLATVILVGILPIWGNNWIIHLLSKFRPSLRQLVLSLAWCFDGEARLWQRNIQPVLENYRGVYKNLDKFVYVVKGGSETIWEDEIHRVQKAFHPIASSLWKGKNVLRIKHIPNDVVGPINYENILREE